MVAARLNENPWLAELKRQAAHADPQRSRQTLVLACSELLKDAQHRLALTHLPALVLAAPLGPLGPCLASGEPLAAALRWAVAEMGVRQIVVCGYSGCDDGEECLGRSTSEERTILGRTRAAQRRLQAAKLRVIEDLQALEDAFPHRHAEDAERLQIEGLLYLMESGLFLQYDAHAGTFLPCAGGEQSHQSATAPVIGRGAELVSASCG